jgi:hypothetical protein
MSKITWSPDRYLSCDTCKVTNCFTPESIKYHVTGAFHFDNKVCIYDDSVEVKVETILYWPNAISPNGDGLNDILSLPIQLRGDISDFEIIVYNRWGEKIFNSIRTNFIFPDVQNVLISGLYLCVVRYKLNEMVFNESFLIHVID